MSKKLDFTKILSLNDKDLDDYKSEFSKFREISPNAELEETEKKYQKKYLSIKEKFSTLKFKFNELKEEAIKIMKENKKEIEAKEKEIKKLKEECFCKNIGSEFENFEDMKKEKRKIEKDKIEIKNRLEEINRREKRILSIKNKIDY